MAGKLNTYEAFIARVEALGFMALSGLVPGFPSLGGETQESQWHTGEPTDPWRWKGRASEEKQLAYGCLLGGQKGFIAPRLYPLFYAASHPAEPMPARWSGGTVSQPVWQVWQIYEEQGSLNVSALRQQLGVTRKEGGSALDTALTQLQKEFYLTVDGNEHKLNAQGEPYGWAAIRYSRVEDWAPADWLAGAKTWPAEEARAAILEEALKHTPGLDAAKLAKKLGWG